MTAPREPGLLSQLPLALLCTVVATAIVQANGGIWEHVGGADLHSYFVPRFEASAAAVRAGRLPLWNPDEYCGEPFFASPQVGTLYAPVTVLFSLFSARPALQLLWVFHVLILSWSVLTLLARAVPSPWARAAGVAIALGGLPYGPGGGGGMDQPGFIGGAAWFPVLLLCLDRALGATSPARWIAALGLASGGQWLSGYPDFAMDSAVLLAVVALCDGRGKLVRRVAILAAGLGLGIALVAIQLLPLAEAVRESVRSDRLPFYPMLRAGFAIDSLRALWARVVALGPLPLAIALAAAFRPTRTTLAWAAAFAWATFAVTPPLSLLYRLPPFSGSRLPVGWWFIAPILLGCLAAVGLERLAERGGRLLHACAVLLAVALALDAGRSLWRVPEALPQRAPDPQVVERRGEELQRVQSIVPPGTRLLGIQPILGTLRYRLRNAGGYDPLLPRRIHHLLGALGGEMLRVRPADLAAKADVAALLGVGIVVAPARVSATVAQGGFAPIGAISAGDVVLYRPAVPRTYLVHRAVALDGDRASLAWALEHASEARDVVGVEAVPAALVGLALPSDAAAEQAAVVDEDPERVAIRTQVASPGLLVLGDTWAPGWGATVDGAAREILIVNHAFRGVRVDPGAREVVFRYRPGWLFPGAGISIAALALTIGLIVRPAS